VRRVVSVRPSVCHTGVLRRNAKQLVYGHQHTTADAIIMEGRKGLETPHFFRWIKNNTYRNQEQSIVLFVQVPESLADISDRL